MSYSVSPTGLENRENQHLQGVVDEREAARRMQKEVCSLVYCSSLPPQTLTVYIPNAPPFLPLPHLKIERLREEGYLKIKEQQELLKQQLLKQGGR